VISPFSVQTSAQWNFYRADSAGRRQIVSQRGGVAGRRPAGFTGGYIDAYTWIFHRVFANAQTANLVFL
jgi:hypothetical protein